MIPNKNVVPINRQTPKPQPDEELYTAVWSYMCGEAGVLFDDLEAAFDWLEAHPEAHVNPAMRELVARLTVNPKDPFAEVPAN